MDDGQKRLANKRAVITGGGGSIGGVTARMFAGHGASVVVADNHEVRGGEAVEAIRSNGGSAYFVCADVTVKESVTELVAEADSLMSGIDVWMNNAGMSLNQSHLHEMAPEQWAADMDLNLNSHYLCSRGVLPVMIREGGGSIISISSINALWCIGEFAYSAAKAAVVSMIKNIAVTYGHKGIRANVICPGTMVTRRSVDYFKKNPQAKAQLAEWYPVGRLGEADDVANLAVFLASDESTFMTGATLVLDGGLTAGSRMYGRRQGGIQE